MTSRRFFGSTIHLDLLPWGLDDQISAYVLKCMATEFFNLGLALGRPGPDVRSRLGLVQGWSSELKLAAWSAVL